MAVEANNDSNNIKQLYVMVLQGAKTKATVAMTTTTTKIRITVKATEKINKLIN